MTSRPTKLWFKAHRYGYGWTPASWEGWAMIALYFLSVWGAFTCSYMRATSSPEDFILYRYIPQVIGLTFMLLFIAYLKGEKPHWSSGDTNKKEKK